MTLTELRKTARAHLRQAILLTRSNRFEEARFEAEIAVLTIERCLNHPPKETSS